MFTELESLLIGFEGIVGGNVGQLLEDGWGDCIGCFAYRCGGSLGGFIEDC